MWQEDAFDAWLSRPAIQGVAALKLAGGQLKKLMYIFIYDIFIFISYIGWL